MKYVPREVVSLAMSHGLLVAQKFFAVLAAEAVTESMFMPPGLRRLSHMIALFELIRKTHEADYMEEEPSEKDLHEYQEFLSQKLIGLLNIGMSIENWRPIRLSGENSSTSPIMN